MKKILFLLMFPIICFGQTASDFLESGNAKYDLKDYNGAISDYTKAIELDPDYADAYNNRGLSKFKLEDYKGAIADYTKVIELKPDDAATFYNSRGILKKKLKDYDGAITDYNKAISLNPDFAEAYKNRGISKENLGQPYCSDYKKACDLGKSDCCEWYNSDCRYVNYMIDGYNKYSSKDYEGAISDYSYVIMLKPDFVDAYLSRGGCKGKIGDTVGAIADFTKAIELDPNNAYAYSNRGFAKLNSGKPYCSDYKKACDLGKSDCCEWYNNQCR